MTKNNLYRRHNKALKHIKNLGELNIRILNEVLCFNSLITKSHFYLCKSLVNNPITLDLPWPHTANVAKLSKIAGVENLDSLRKSGKYVPGCYRI